MSLLPAPRADTLLYKQSPPPLTPQSVMPKAAPFSPLRLISPIQLLFCLALFFLPWIEMTCTMPPSAAKSMPKEEIEKTKKDLGIDPTKPVSMVSQSGLQIATGGSSPGSDMKKIEAKMKESFKGAAIESDKSSSKDDDVKGAPLLFLYPVLLICGIGVAFIPMPTMIRRFVLAGCCAAALGVVGLQALLGFPMENEIKKKNDEMKALGGGGGGLMFGPPDAGGKAKGKDAKSDGKEADVVRVSWKFSLYLTFLLLLGAAGTAFLDGAGGGGARYGRKYGRRDDYDEDDYDDEEDDRPRRRSRRDDYDDDDEDDRPRKKKPAEPLSLDDDEPPPPPPPKKSRREEVDDRPRKKRDDAPPAPAGGNPFDFSDPPPKKKPRRRDEDEDDDYDEDDRPRKKYR